MLLKTKPILSGIEINFVEKFSEAIVNSTNVDNQEGFILGDFNMNVLDDSHLVNSYKEICSLKQIIDTFTRITEKTSTLIDHPY